MTLAKLGVNMKPDYDTMNETDVREINETDVREIIVRPLLNRLGYAHATQANIRTEVPLRYDRAFLGRKRPTKDPPLAGRADYVCDAISYGRWTVEVKSPNHSLSRDDVEQAHTYSAHPEISASHFLLTNGREFRLYVTGQLENPILKWMYEETDQYIMNLFNIVGYEAIRKRAEILRPDINKPLGPGLSSKVRIVGGEVLYIEHRSDDPIFKAEVLSELNHMVSAVTGIGVERANDGRLRAVVTLLSPFHFVAELNRVAGIGNLEFFSADEFVSNDINRPTIFQNVVEIRIEPGATLRVLPGFPAFVIPLGFRMTTYTEATGYFYDNVFEGVMSFEYNYKIDRGRPLGNRQIDALLGSNPKVEGAGKFKVNLA